MQDTHDCHISILPILADNQGSKLLSVDHKYRYSYRTFLHSLHRTSRGHTLMDEEKYKAMVEFQNISFECKQYKWKNVIDHTFPSFTCPWKKKEKYLETLWEIEKILVTRLFQLPPQCFVTYYRRILELHIICHLSKQILPCGAHSFYRMYVYTIFCTSLNFL